MGTYYTATTVIGFKVSTKKCYVRRSEPNCSHSPPNNVKFCPQCGVRVGTRDTSYMKPEYSDDFRDEFVNHLRAPFVYQEHYDGEGDCFWIGYGSHADLSETERREPKPYEEIKAEIVAMMEPFTSTGLFELKDEDFAIWTLNAGA
jgi:hypothetical protein